MWSRSLYKYTFKKSTLDMINQVSAVNSKNSKRDALGCYSQVRVVLNKNSFCFAD